MKNFYLVFFLTAIILGTSLVSAAFYQVDYNRSSSTSGSGAEFAVQVLKYDPYPVSPGEWFDMWVKVQNIGGAAAKNAKFELVPVYPFTSNDSLVRDYGMIPQYGDTSEVILKYRVFTADNAPIGDSNMSLITTTDSKDPNSISITTQLPITVGKTKTDFDVVPQGSTAQGISFAISNIGENPATAVTVTLEPGVQNFTGNAPSQNYSNGNRTRSMNITGPMSSIIGNLAAGDFTSVSFQASLGSTRAARIKIDYTDIAGVRNSIEKEVIISGTSAGGSRTIVKPSTTTSKYVYIVLGIVIGLIGMLIYQRVRKKR